MRIEIKVKDVTEFFNVYPSIEKKKNRIIVRVKQKVYIEYLYVPYIPLQRIDLQLQKME